MGLGFKVSQNLGRAPIKRLMVYLGPYWGPFLLGN